MTDRPLSDGEKPAHGQQVITATACIHHDFNGVQKVFLAKRVAHKKFLPSVYEIPGGHIDYGEDIVAGLKREIQEEFQKDITVGEPFAVFTYTNEVKGSHSIEVIYFAQFVGAVDDMVLDPESHDSFGWFAEDEIDTVVDINRSAGDPEILAVKRSFRLLAGESLRF